MPKLIAHISADAGTDVVLDGPIGSPGADTTLTIGSEQMFVVDGLGTPNLTVERAANGTTRALHTVGTSVTATVASGAVIATDGTTTVNPATKLTFPSGGVAAGGAGEAVVLPIWTIEENEVYFVAQVAGGASNKAQININANSDIGDATAALTVTDYGGANGAQILLRGNAGSIVLTGTTLTWNGGPVGTQAAHLANGSTVDQLLAALIASGLMAAP